MSGRNPLAAEAAAGVGHHVALSVFGTDRLLASDHFRTKIAPENLIKALPAHTRSFRLRNFSSLWGASPKGQPMGQTVRLPPALMQPDVPDDAATVMARSRSRKR